MAPTNASRLDSLAVIGRFGMFAGTVFVRTLLPPWYPREVIHHLWTTTIRCILPVVAVTIPFGMVIALQGLELFHLFGAERLLSSLVSMAMLRELSPIMASVLVAAQGGSSAAAELGSMRIKEELDATELMAVDSIRWHVVPRVLGLTLACPILNTLGSLAGVGGSYVVAVIFQGEPGGIFFAELWALTSPLDIWAGVVKTGVFGLTIGMVATFHGYHVTGGAAGVGKAVNDTVVQSVLIFAGVNYFMTSALFGAGVV